MKGFGKQDSNTNKNKSPKSGSQLLEEAVNCHKKGDIKSAESLYLKAISTGYNHEIAFSNLGVIYKNSGRVSEAISTYEQAIRLKPEFADAYSNLGNLYKERRMLNEALALFIKASELKPNDPDFLNNIGSIYLAQNQFEEAETALQKSLKSKKTSSSLINLSILYGQTGDEDKCISCALEAVKLDTNSAYSLTNLARQYVIFQKDQEGLEAAMQAIRINESTEKAYIIASKILAKRKLFANARSLLENGVRKIRNNHLIEGELVRVKFLEGMANSEKGTSNWTDEEDFYYEDCGGSSLIISFGSNGIRTDNESNIPSFNFKRTLSGFKEHDKIYVRDLDRFYYMNGIKNSAPSILELKDLILKHIRQKEYKSVVTIGASSGGFGALLYGNLINADHMIAFNPQTVLDNKKFTIINDNVFTVDVCKMLQNSHPNDEFFHKCLDLKNFIPFKGKAVIHYSDKSLHEIDKKYAEYLEHENCSIIAHDSSTHLLALQLKQKGLLDVKIAKSINTSIN